MSTGSRSWVWTRLAPLVLVLATAAVYHELPSHDFVNLDDPIYVLENPNLEESLRPGAFAWTLRPYEHNWIPLTWASLQLDHLLFGREAGGYLVVNGLLHAATALLLYLALAAMTGAPGRSLFVALVFVVHPVHVESVAWVSERKDVLSAFFFAVALLVHARTAGDEAGWKRWLPTTLCCALGLLAKPMLVTLPFVLLLLDFWPLRRLGSDDPAGPLLDPARVRAAVIEKLPMFVLVAAAAVVTVVVQQSTGAVTSLEAISLSTRISNALISAVTYLGATVWPVNLAVFYPYPPVISAYVSAACGTALAMLTGTAWRQASKRPWLVVGWFWYLGMLVPVIGLVQVGLQARADRYLHLPQVGLTIALAWSAAEVFGGSTAGRRALAGVAAAVVLALGITSVFQVRHWRDSDALWSRALAVTEGNFAAHRALGDDRMLEGRFDEAGLHFAEAARLRPNYPEAELGLADALAAQGDLDRAAAIYRRWMALTPSDPRPVGSLGLALLRAGRLDEARQAFELGMTLDPGAAELHAGLGVVWNGQGKLPEAIAAYREALRLDPRLVDAANNLAWLLATTRDPSLRAPAEAVRIAEAAAAHLRQPDPGLLDTLAAAYAAAGRQRDAVATGERAAEIARQGGAAALAADIETRVALYREGRAYVEAP